MPGARNSSFGIQSFASGRVRQMSGTPNIVEFRRADDGQVRDDRTPRTILVVGKINRIHGALDLAQFRQADDFVAYRVARTAELPGVNHVTDQLPFVRIV